MTGDRPRRESAFSLVRRLVGGGVGLARLELQRGRQEVSERIAETRIGAILLGVTAALGLLVLVSLDVTIILGVASLFEVIVSAAVAIIIGVTFLLLLLGFAVLRVANLVAIALLLVVAAAFVVPAYLGFTATWFAALFVLVVQAALAALFAILGIRRLRSPVPEETIASVKEDIEWAKRLLRRE